MKRKTAVLYTLLFCSYSIMAQAIYTPQDSIRIDEILLQVKREQRGNDICHIAKKFIGTPYVASTLDSTVCERLIINTRQMDCTTFVESIVALSLTASENGNFTDYSRNLQKVRYRNAQCNSYPDRLHYISQWIDDNRLKGIMDEITTPSHIAIQELDLNFMSSNPGSYPQLKNNAAYIAKIAEYEAPYRNREAKYIPKHLLDFSRAASGIEDGDILAIVTAIKGLDVTHVGFAYWIDGKLHLIHASSGKGNIIIDPVPLYDYMASKKNNLGIRVIRVRH